MRPDVGPVFSRHFHALLMKRMHLFTRDIKGFFFLVFIPVVVVLAVVLIIYVRGGVVCTFVGMCDPSKTRHRLLRSHARRTPC